MKTFQPFFSRTYPVKPWCTPSRELRSIWESPWKWKITINEIQKITMRSAIHDHDQIYGDLILYIISLVRATLFQMQLENHISITWQCRSKVHTEDSNFLSRWSRLYRLMRLDRLDFKAPNLSVGPRLRKAMQPASTTHGLSTALTSVSPFIRARRVWSLIYRRLTPPELVCWLLSICRSLRQQFPSSAGDAARFV